MKQRVTACVSLAISSTLASGSAFAQSQEPTRTSTAGTGVEEVLVTATRREERLRDVPISITALTREMLSESGVVTTRDLTLVTPGVRIEGGAYVQPAIRGITSTQTTSVSEANVATYVDGVYQQTQLGSIYDLPDVQQIEVLKGPQGTLFGRNATGGAIIIRTLAPDLQSATGKLSTSYGRFDSAMGSGYASIPLVADRAALSVAGIVNHEGSYKRNVLTGKREDADVDTSLARVKLRVQPWEGADFTLTGMSSRRKDESSAVKLSSLNGNNAANRNPALPPVVIADEPHEYGVNGPTYIETKVKQGSLRGEIEMGPGALTIISAYTKLDPLILFDGDSSPRATLRATVTGDVETTSQEVYYSTDQLGRFRGTVGAFFYRSKGGLDPSAVNNFAVANYTFDRTKAAAGFGELTVDLSDRWSLTGGLRYSHERKEAYALRLFNTSVPPTTLPRLAPPAEFNSTDPRASMVYKLTDATNVYFTYSRGFKSGVFNTVGFQSTPVAPEEVTAYEVGIKSAPLPNLTLNMSGFYYDYTNLQVGTLRFVNGLIVTVLENAATARTYGLEAAGSWHLSDDFKLSFGASWLDAKYDSFPAASGAIPNPDGLGGNVTVARDVSGNRMIRTPEFSGNLTATYGMETSMGRIQGSGSVLYASKLYEDVFNRVAQGSYTTINAKLSWFPYEHLEVGLWGRNLTDNTVIRYAQLSNNDDGVEYNPPRTYGVHASVSF